MKKRFISMLLVMVLSFTFTITSFAAAPNVDISWDEENSCIVVKNIPINDGNTYKVILQKDTKSMDANWYAEETTNLPINADGKYVVLVARRLQGTSYKIIYRKTMDIKGSKPYLGSSEYIDFEDAEKLLSLDVIENIINNKNMSDTAKAKAAYKFVKNSMSYDSGKVTPGGYTPDADTNLKKGKGICFDYASMLAIILRNAGIETKMVFGYANREYHAWNEVKLNGKWVMVDACWNEYATTKYSRVATVIW